MPALSMTHRARWAFSSCGHCAAIRARAASSLKAVRDTRRFTCSSAGGARRYMLFFCNTCFVSLYVLLINEAPYQTNVYIVESDAPPAGVGEPGVPPFVAAYCNAIFAATGKRVRELPFGKYKLS